MLLSLIMPTVIFDSLKVVIKNLNDFLVEFELVELIFINLKPFLIFIESFYWLFIIRSSIFLLN